MNKTTIYFSDNQQASLEALAKREARPKAEIIRDAVDQYIGQRKHPLPSWIGMIDDDDGSLTSTNIDDWLGSHWRPE